MHFQIENIKQTPRFKCDLGNSHKWRLTFKWNNNNNNFFIQNQYPKSKKRRLENKTIYISNEGDDGHITIKDKTNENENTTNENENTTKENENTYKRK